MKYLNIDIDIAEQFLIISMKIHRKSKLFSKLTNWMRHTSLSVNDLKYGLNCHNLRFVALDRH